MNREQKINRVLAGLSHTGYTTEIEKCEARLLIEELKEENEKLNHYKLLYQKVKERNDKAIEYNKALAKLYDIGSMERSNADTNLLILGDEETIRKLKGENNE